MTIPNLPSISDPKSNGVVIKDADTRKWIGITLWGVSIAAALVSMFVQFFPEVAGDGDILQRGVAFTNAVVSFLAGSFGLAVSTPNTK